MTSITRRLVLIKLLINAVLLPILFFALDAVVAKSITDVFVDDVRIQGRVFADNLDFADLDASDLLLVEQLDSAVMSSQVVYAALLQYGERTTSSLMSEADVTGFVEDFGFGEHGDNVYYLALPVFSGNEMAILELGFDETSARLQSREARRAIILVLVAYLIISLVAMSYLGAHVVSPIKWLQNASRRIASGEYDKKLAADSDIAEIHELATDLEKMRSELVGTNARLKDEILEREAAEEERRKLETRLQQAQRLESLGTLAGGVAHEFNNLLQPMLLYTDLALEDLPHNSGAQRNLERVMDLANRAKGLSRQILTFGRPAKDEEFEIVSFAPVVVEAVSIIRTLLPATIDIRTDIHGDDARIKCDPAQIQQLVFNLCNNASRALQGRGHIMITLGSEEISERRAGGFANLNEGHYAVLEVTDTGQGMDPETAERAFEPFYTTQDVGEGTGLGLSVVHGIVMRHGGDITLTSRPGEGTTIRAYFPLAPQSS